MTNFTAGVITAVVALGALITLGWMAADDGENKKKKKQQQEMFHFSDDEGDMNPDFNYPFGEEVVIF